MTLVSIPMRPDHPTSDLPNPALPGQPDEIDPGSNGEREVGSSQSALDRPRRDRVHQLPQNPLVRAWRVEHLELEGAAAV